MHLITFFIIYCARDGETEFTWHEIYILLKPIKNNTKLLFNMVEVLLFLLHMPRFIYYLSSKLLYRANYFWKRFFNNCLFPSWQNRGVNNIITFEHMLVDDHSITINYRYNITVNSTPVKIIEKSFLQYWLNTII